MNQLVKSPCGRHCDALIPTSRGLRWGGHLVRKWWVEPRLLALCDAAAASAQPTCFPTTRDNRVTRGARPVCTQGLIFVPNGLYQSNFQHQRTSDCMCSRASSVTQLCLTQLCVTPWTSPPGSSEMGFPRREHWNVLACPPP